MWVVGFEWENPSGYSNLHRPGREGAPDEVESDAPKIEEDAAAACHACRAWDMHMLPLPSTDFCMKEIWSFHLLVGSIVLSFL